MTFDIQSLFVFLCMTGFKVCDRHTDTQQCEKLSSAVFWPSR